MRLLFAAALTVAAITCPLRAQPALARQEADKQMDEAYREFAAVLKAAPQARYADAELVLMLSRVRCNKADQAVVRQTLEKIDERFPPMTRDAEKPILALLYRAMV